MNRRGRSAWTTRASPARLQSICVAVAGGGTAREIYLRSGLEGRVRFQTFRHWVTCKRRDLAARDDADAAGTSQSNATTARGRWGNRGIRRIRRAGLGLVGEQDRETVVALTLVDCAEELRLLADRLVDVAHTLFGPMVSERNRKKDEGTGAPGG